MSEMIFEYRRLDVSMWYGPLRGPDPGAWHCEVRDSATDEEEVVSFTPDPESDTSAQLKACQRVFFDYLNTLGSDGWQLCSFSLGDHDSYGQRSPSGIYVMVRATSMRTP